MSRLTVAQTRNRYISQPTVSGRLAKTAGYLAVIFGVAAGLVGVYHGYNDTLQGSVAPSSIFINAIGPPCTGGGCFPAMTVIPNFLAAGSVTITVSLVILVLAAAFAQRPRM